MRRSGKAGRCCSISTAFPPSGWRSSLTHGASACGAAFTAALWRIVHSEREKTARCAPPSRSSAGEGRYRLSPPPSPRSAERRAGPQIPLPGKHRLTIRNNKTPRCRRYLTASGRYRMTRSAGGGRTRASENGSRAMIRKELCLTATA